MRGAIKFIKRFLLTLVILIGLVAGLQYLYCPIYIFPQPKPFSGDRIYNPYANIDSAGWLKANFHLHTRQWGGITNGHNTSVEMADSIYRYLNYDIIGISDYQSINHYRAKEKGFIPEYEHGYMFPKNHQIVLGAKKVSWLDYPFPQTLHNKQHIIEMLKSDTSAFVAIAHPNMRNSYPAGDFKFLANYDCIEIFDRIIYSVAQWDTALSNGLPAFATSVDDNHDINDITEVAANFTLVNATELDQQSILGAMKAGKMIACEMYNQRGRDFIKKREHCLFLPVIKHVTVENNRLNISADTVMAMIEFIGQNGIVKKTVTDLKEAFYDFTSEDTYIRTDIRFADSTIYHLNPIMRYSGDKMEQAKPVIDEKSTMIRRILFYIALFAVAIILYFRFKRQPRSK